LVRGKVVRARAQAVAEGGDVNPLEVRWALIELREALRQKSRGGVSGFHHEELVERRGDLNESLETVPFHLVRRDSPTLLPRLVSLEELSGIEEALAARKGGIHRSLPALEPYADLARRVPRFDVNNPGTAAYGAVFRVHLRVTSTGIDVNLVALAAERTPQGPRFHAPFTPAT
jgi:hypothetical protein